MPKILQKSNTKWKSTTLIIRNIILDLYTKNRFYEIIYKWLEPFVNSIVNDDNSELEPTEENIKIINDKWQLNIMNLIDDLDFKWKNIREVNDFFNAWLKATYIEGEYWISRLTLKERLKDFFILEYRKEGGTKVLYLKPNVKILGEIAMYLCVRSSNFNEDNTFLKLINILEAS